jgi:hypothetical protein
MIPDKQNDPHGRPGVDLFLSLPKKELFLGLALVCNGLHCRIDCILVAEVV